MLRLTDCQPPPQNRGETRYAHTRQSPVGRTEQDPTSQHQIAAAIALRPRLQRAVSPSLSSVWCNTPAGDQLHSHTAVEVIGSGKLAATIPGRAVSLSDSGARASRFGGQDAELVALGIGKCDPAAAIGPPVISKL